MKYPVLIAIALLASPTLARDDEKEIGQIEFFGQGGANVASIRAALPFKERDAFDRSSFGQKAVDAEEAVKRLIGRAPTDIAPVCCNEKGNWIIYIGLSGEEIRYNSTTQRDAKLPEVATDLYARFMRTLMDDVQQGASAEDDSKGYALSANPRLRAVQHEMRSYALEHEAVISRVLATAKDDEQRIAAAQLLGYVEQSDRQINDLVHASNDQNATVRNNATRALILLAESSREMASKIPVQHFAELLRSGTWSDLNKASNLLSAITKSRNPKTLDALRTKEVRERLIEMARWRSGHAQPAMAILGRLAAIDEDRLQELIAIRKVDAIIADLPRD